MKRLFLFSLFAVCSFGQITQPAASGGASTSSTNTWSAAQTFSSIIANYTGSGGILTFQNNGTAKYEIGGVAADGNLTIFDDAAGHSLITFGGGNVTLVPGGGSVNIFPLRSSNPNHNPACFDSSGNFEVCPGITWTVGSAIASATTIAPTAPITHITGTTPVATITPPGFCSTTASRGCSITLIPDAAFTTTTGGNIALASTAVVNKTLILTYDVTAAKWYPSY